MPSAFGIAASYLPFHSWAIRYAGGGGHGGPFCQHPATLHLRLFVRPIFALIWHKDIYHHFGVFVSVRRHEHTNTLDFGANVKHCGQNVDENSGWIAWCGGVRTNGCGEAVCSHLVQHNRSQKLDAMCDVRVFFIYAQTGIHAFTRILRIVVVHLSSTEGELDRRRNMLFVTEDLMVGRHLSCPPLINLFPFFCVCLWHVVDTSVARRYASFRDRDICWYMVGV